MESAAAADIISQGCLLINEWINQHEFPDASGDAIKDRDIARCLRNLREAAHHAPRYEAVRIAAIVELAETRLNTAR